MTDEEIFNSLHKYFDLSNAGAISIENGEVSCEGRIHLLPNKYIQKLPVKFKSVGTTFGCYNNRLESLEGAPQTVGHNFYCQNNQLTSLAGAPQSLMGNFFCNDNKLTSLTGAPRYVGKSFVCRNNPLTSLAGAPQYVGKEFELTYSKNLALLPLLMVKGCESIIFRYHNDWYWHTKLSDILNRYLGTGTQGMLPCADEMIEAGYGSNAHYD